MVDRRHFAPCPAARGCVVVRGPWRHVFISRLAGDGNRTYFRRTQRRPLAHRKFRLQGQAGRCVGRLGRACGRNVVRRIHLAGCRFARLCSRERRGQHRRRFQRGCGPQGRGFVRQNKTDRRQQQSGRSPRQIGRHARSRGLERSAVADFSFWFPATSGWAH